MAAFTFHHPFGLRNTEEDFFGGLKDMKVRKRKFHGKNASINSALYRPIDGASIPENDTHLDVTFYAQ